MTIPTIQCPRCQGNGSLPAQEIVPEKPYRIRCPLCWGDGSIPALEIVAEGENKVALHYWLCKCREMHQRIHPSNHDVCLICDRTEENASLVLAEDVQAFFQNSYEVRLEFVDLT